METVKIDKIIRSKRKTLHVQVDTDTSVTLRVPDDCSNGKIEKYIESQKDWILGRQKYAREHCKQVSPKKYIEGEKFHYLGEVYPLVYTKLGDAPLSLIGEKFMLHVNQSKNARDLFVRWYKNEANKIIPYRVKWYSSDTGLNCNKIKIGDSRSHWGYCGSNGNLTFSWTLIMAPLVVIDCVIVHELLHTRIRGHSKDFWDGVRISIPGVDYCRNWLNENENLLNIFYSSS